MQIFPDIKMKAVKECSMGELISFDNGNLNTAFLITGNNNSVLIIKKDDSTECSLSSIHEDKEVISYGLEYHIEINVSSMNRKKSDKSVASGSMAQFNNEWHLCATSVFYNLATGEMKSNYPDGPIIAFEKWDVYLPQRPGALIRSEPLVSFRA